MAIFKDGAPAASWGFGETANSNRLARATVLLNVGSHAASTGLFTVPSGHAGTYFLSVSYMVQSAGSGTAHVAVRKNGTIIDTSVKAYTTGTTYDQASCMTLQALSDGDTIDFYVTGPKTSHAGHGTCNVYMMY